MGFSLDDLKAVDAKEMRDRPVLPKGKYKWELGAGVFKQEETDNGKYVRFSLALTPLEPKDIHEDDLEAAAERWGGSVEEFIAEAGAWFSKNLWEPQNFKDLHKQLCDATGTELPGDMKGLAASLKGLTAFGTIDTQVRDGVLRNKEVRALYAD